MERQAAMVRAPLYPLTGSGPVVLAALGGLAVLPLGGFVAWVVLVLAAALAVRETVRGRDAFPGLDAVRKVPGLGALWARALVTTSVVLLPILVSLSLAFLAGSFPDEDVLETAAKLAIPIGFFLGFIGVLFVPAALVLAVSDPDLFAILQPGRFRHANENLAAATVVSGLGAFFLLIALGVVNKLAPTTLARGLDMAILSGFLLVVARLAGLGARSRVPLA